LCDAFVILDRRALRGAAALFPALALPRIADVAFGAARVSVTYDLRSVGIGAPSSRSAKGDIAHAPGFRRSARFR